MTHIRDLNHVANVPLLNWNAGIKMLVCRQKGAYDPNDNGTSYSYIRNVCLTKAENISVFSVLLVIQYLSKGVHNLRNQAIF